MGAYPLGRLDRLKFVFHGAASAYYMYRAIGGASGNIDYSSAMSLYAGFAKHFDACVELESKCGSVLPRHCAVDFGKEFARGVIDVSYGLLSDEELIEKLRGHEFAKKLEAMGGKCTSCGRRCELHVRFDDVPVD
jgi:hypothetical protein